MPRHSPSQMIDTINNILNTKYDNEQNSHWQNFLLQVVYLALQALPRKEWDEFLSQLWLQMMSGAQMDGYPLSTIPGLALLEEYAKKVAGQKPIISVLIPTLDPNVRYEGKSLSEMTETQTTSGKRELINLEDYLLGTNGNILIPIVRCFEQAATNLEGAFLHSADGSAPLDSQELTNLRYCASSISNAYMREIEIRTEILQKPNNLSFALLQLAYGIKTESLQETVRAKEAEPQANNAIELFYPVWASLSDNIKQEIGSLKLGYYLPTLQCCLDELYTPGKLPEFAIINALARKNLSESIESLIYANHERLSTIEIQSNIEQRIKSFGIKKIPFRLKDGLRAAAQLPVIFNTKSQLKAMIKNTIRLLRVQKSRPNIENLKHIVGVGVDIPRAIRIALSFDEPKNPQQVLDLFNLMYSQETVMSQNSIDAFVYFVVFEEQIREFIKVDPPIFWTFAQVWGSWVGDFCQHFSFEELASLVHSPKEYVYLLHNLDEERRIAFITSNPTLFKKLIIDNRNLSKVLDALSESKSAVELLHTFKTHIADFLYKNFFTIEQSLEKIPTDILYDYIFTEKEKCVMSLDAKGFLSIMSLFSSWKPEKILQELNDDLPLILTRKKITHKTFAHLLKYISEAVSLEFLIGRMADTTQKRMVLLEKMPAQNNKMAMLKIILASWETKKITANKIQKIHAFLRPGEMTAYLASFVDKHFDQITHITENELFLITQMLSLFPEKQKILLPSILIDIEQRAYRFFDWLEIIHADNREIVIARITITTVFPTLSSIEKNSSKIELYRDILFPKIRAAIDVSSDTFSKQLRTISSNPEKIEFIFTLLGKKLGSLLEKGIASFLKDVSFSISPFSWDYTPRRDFGKAFVILEILDSLDLLRDKLASSDAQRELEDFFRGTRYVEQISEFFTQENDWEVMLQQKIKLS